MKLNKRNKICAILWQDAAFSMQAEIPGHLPPPTLTVGFVIKKNKEFTIIATSVSYNKGILLANDGFLIPNKAIINFKKIDYYEKDR